MGLRMNVERRRRQPEIMDEPDLDPRRHGHALRSLERINLWSGTARSLWLALGTLRERTPTRPLRILDVATGAGDVPVRLWQRARRAGLAFDIQGCDRSPQALAHARQRAEEKGAAVGFFACDALHDALPGGYDVVMSSLFLHHLDEEPATDLLRRMAEAAGRLVLVNDLVRSRSGLALAYLGTRLLSTSPVVHYDGPRSVEGAYTVEEVVHLAGQAGLRDFTMRRCWPCRFLFRWSRL